MMNILFTSVGRRSYLLKYFREALGGQGKIYAANSTALSPAFLVADETVITPLIYDDNYIPFLLNYCKLENIKVIISLFDVDLMILAQNRELFEKQGITVVISDTEVIEVCNDKWKTYCFLNKYGLKTPHTYLSIDAVENEVNSGQISYPLIIKPRWGMGSIAMFQADNDEELNVLFKKVKRDIKNSYLKYESEFDMENSVIIQEKLKGQEYGLDVINDLKGKYITTIVKKKCAMRAGETDCAITVNEQKLKHLGEKLGGLLMHRANLDVDVFMVGNQCYVLEMNARFGGGYPFSHLAGVNLPRAILGWLNNEHVSNEILLEQFNVLGHKDINIIQLYEKVNNFL